MLPAFKIPLSVDDLAQIGEIAAIQGQIDYMINAMTAKILGLSHSTIEEIYGTAALASKVVQLKRYAQNVTEPPELQEKLAQIAEAIAHVTKQRNDFAHAIYGYDYDGIGDGHMLIAQSPTGHSSMTMYVNTASGNSQKEIKPAAYRSQKMKARNDPNVLPFLKNEFSRISQSVGYLYGLLLVPDQSDPMSRLDIWQYLLDK